MRNQVALALTIFALLPSASAKAIGQKTPFDSFAVVWTNDKEMNTIEFRCVEENNSLAIRCSTKTLTIRRRIDKPENGGKVPKYCLVTDGGNKDEVYESKSRGEWSRVEEAFICGSAVQKTIVFKNGFANYQETVLQNNTDLVMCINVIGKPGTIKRFFPLTSPVDESTLCDLM